MRQVIRVLAVFFLIGWGTSTCDGQGQAVPVLRRAVQVLTGVAAAESFARSGEAYVETSEIDATLQELKSQYSNAEGSAVYSLRMTTNGGYWSDFWSKPDLMFVLSTPETGRVIVPAVWFNHPPNVPVADQLICEHIAPGSRVDLYIYDDDSSSDEVWNSIMQSRFEVSASSGIKAAAPYFVDVSAAGSFRVLHRDVTIDAPDFIASTSFVVPETEDGVWVTSTRFTDSNGETVGDLDLSCIWSGVHAASQRSEQITRETEDAKSAWKTAIFWGVLGAVLLAAFVASLFRDGTASHSSPTEESGKPAI